MRNMFHHDTETKDQVPQPIRDDVGYVPFAMGHYVENTGDTTLRFLEMFKSDHFADVSLNQWLALTPPELVQAHLHLNQKVMGALHKQKRPVVK